MIISLRRPFSIGGVLIPNRVVLGPMAGVTCRPFRQHMKEHGVGLVHTEMVSAYGIVYGNLRTLDYLNFDPAERPIAVQLFGANPEVLAEAASRVMQLEPRPDLIDINMGCPARKVVKTGAGAALLGDPERAVAVAAAVAEATAAAHVPVTVKLRSGLVPGDGVAELLAPRLEEVGVAGLTLHPRAASQFYRGEADHSVSGRVARLVHVPLVVSGDVISVEAAAAILDQAECAGVMVARGVLGNPWLVGDLLAYPLWDDVDRLDGVGSGEEAARRASPPPPSRPPDPETAIADLLRLFGRARTDMGDRRAVPWIRSHIGWYLRRLRLPAATIGALRLVSSAYVLEQELRQLALTVAEGASYNPLLIPGAIPTRPLRGKSNGGIRS